MMKKPMHVKLSAESIVGMIAEVAHKALIRAEEGHFLSEEEYREILHAPSHELHEKVKENLHGTVECHFLDLQELIEAYFDARDMDDDTLEALVDKSRK